MDLPYFMAPFLLFLLHLCRPISVPSIRFDQCGFPLLRHFCWDNLQESFNTFRKCHNQLEDRCFNNIIDNPQRTVTASGICCGIPVFVNTLPSILYR